MSHSYPPDRNKSVEWAKHVLAARNRKRYVILDTETTGMGPRDEVIQIAVIDLEGAVRLNSYIRPIFRKRKIPENAAAIHGITMAMLEDAPTYPDIFALVEKSVDGRTVISFNAEYDHRLLDQTARLYEGPFLNTAWECAMIQYSRFVGEWRPDQRTYRLQQLPSASHSALADCQAVLELIRMVAATPLWRSR